MNRTVAVVLTFSVVASACASAASDEPEPTAATSTGQEEGPADGAGVVDVILTTSDGLDLDATLYEGGVNWVVLAHMLPADKESWHALAAALQLRGFSVLAYNNRGYGDSEGAREPYSLLVDADAAFNHATDNGAAGIIYGGASMNGAAAIALGASKDLMAVFTLSAVPSFPNVPDAADSLGDITEPALFVAAQDDGNAAANAEVFAAGTASGEAMILDAGGHGTRMLDAHPELIETIVDWVAEKTG